MRIHTHERKKIFLKALRDWYSFHHRKLPWRNTKDPYKILVSEIMLQQTTVKTVIPYYQRWMDLFPNMKALSLASLQSVLRAWQGLGYYQRAKNLHKTAKIIQAKYRGEVPDDYEMLSSLPGIGPYTTAAVLSLAYGKAHQVIDANVRRILMRLKRYKYKSDSKHDKTLLSFIQPFLPEEGMGEFNQAMMELGAVVCTPKNPACLLCPITDFCSAYQYGEQEIIPLPKKKFSHKIEAVVGIIRKDDKFLIQKRPASGLLADLWEFPGGKRRPEETQVEALVREIKEEIGMDVIAANFLTMVEHAYTDFRVKLQAFECTLSENPDAKNNTNLKWVTLKEMEEYPFPSGSVKIIKYLADIHSGRSGNIP
jgi:A/G-specific adenine glycosylase